MSDVPAVRAQSISKRYRIYPDSSGRLVEWFSAGRLKRHREKWALRDVSFELPRSSALGIVGANGAGKSTLLRIIGGVTEPTSGRFEVNGRLGSLLELGAGFHPGFTGRANVYMNAAIMGIPRREVKERFSELAEFAELGDYLDRPVRTYSSGMSMRLGYAVAMLARPEILILDEILAVGDQHFQKKCMDHIRRIRQDGTSILFVSHSIYHVRQMCDRAIWLQDGQVVAMGDPTQVTDDYVNYTYAHSAGQDAQKQERGLAHTQSSAAHLTGVVVRKAGTKEPCRDFRTGDVMDVEIGFRNPGGTDRVHVGIICNRNDDLQVFTTRSKESGVSASGADGFLTVRIPLQLAAGEYYISGFLLDESCDHILDQRLAGARFRVRYQGMEKGVFIAQAKWLTGSPAL